VTKKLEHELNEADQYFLWVGRALSHWSLVEQALSRIYAACLGDQEAAHSAYWSVLSMDARLNMTDAAFRTRFRKKGDLLKKWNPIKEKIGRKNRKRNDIAHGAVVTLHSKDGSLTKLVPKPWSNPDKLNKEEFAKAMPLDQLEEAAKSFKRTYTRISEFTVDMYQAMM